MWLPRLAERLRTLAAHLPPPLLRFSLPGFEERGVEVWRSGERLARGSQLGVEACPLIPPPTLQRRGALQSMRKRRRRWAGDPGSTKAQTFIAPAEENVSFNLREVTIVSNCSRL